jgi:hypothetical protein
MIDDCRLEIRSNILWLPNTITRHVRNCTVASYSHETFSLKIFSFPGGIYQSIFVPTHFFGRNLPLTFFFIYQYRAEFTYLFNMIAGKDAIHRVHKYHVKKNMWKRRVSLVRRVRPRLCFRWVVRSFSCTRVCCIILLC